MMTIEEIDRQIQELSSQEGYNSDLQFLLSQKTEVPNFQSKVQNKDKRSISNNLISQASNYSKMNNNNNNYYYKQNINEKQNYKNLLNSRKTNYVSFKQKTNLTQKKNENTSQYSQKSHLSTNTNSNITTQKAYQNYNQINKNTLKNILQPSQLNMKKPNTAKIQRPSLNQANKQPTQTEKINQNIEKKLKMYLYDNKKLNNFATLIQEKYQVLKNHQQQLDSELNENSEKQQALEKHVQKENQSLNILQTHLKNQTKNQNQNSNQKNQKNQKDCKNYLSHNGLSNFINNLKFSNQFANSNNNNNNNNNNNKNIHSNNKYNNININNNNKLLAIQHKRERSSTAQNFVKQNKTDKLAITSSNNNTISMFGNLGSCRYKIQTELGKGSYATCKLATDSETKQQVALKCYPRYILNDPIKLRNVKREISILSRINHPNIVQLYNSVEERSQIVLVLEFPCKQSIKNVYKSTAKRSDADLKYIMKQIIQALLYIHEQGIYHRDIKADNILIDEKNTIKIIDFGFAICPPQGQKLKIFCGTPQYMSPEIVNKTHYYGDKADIWAAGIVFYQMLFGQTPYKAFSDSELYQKIRKNKVVFPHPIQPDLKQLILNMLEKNPSQRFDAKQVLNSEYFQS